MSRDIVPDLPLSVSLTEACGGERKATRGIVLHSTRGPTRPGASEPLSAVLEREYAVAVRYMLNPANEVSPHFCVGPREVCRMVPDALIAWHAREHNETHLGIEICQPAYLPPFVDFEVRAAADICARWCWKYGLPPVRVTDDERLGIIAHSDTTQGRRDGKSDPGGKWPWERFLQLTAAKLRELENTEAAYRTVGEGIRTFLREHPSLGSPALSYFDEHGDEIVICGATAKHPHGAWVIWRKWIHEIGREAIRVVSWDRPLEV